MDKKGTKTVTSRTRDPRWHEAMRTAAADRKQLGIKRDLLWDKLQNFWPVEHSYFYNILKGVRPTGHIELLRALAKIFSEMHDPPEERIAKENEYLTKYQLVLNATTAINARAGVRPTRSKNSAIEDFVSVFVTLVPKAAAPARIKQRLMRLASGFGVLKAAVEVNSRTLQMDIAVVEGRGLAQHLGTLERDLRAVTGVEGVLIL